MIISLQLSESAYKLLRDGVLFFGGFIADTYYRKTTVILIS